MDKAKIMKWLKLYKNRMIAVVVIAVILTVAFFAGGKPGAGDSKNGSGDRAELGSMKTGKSPNKEILSDDETTVSNEQSRTEETIPENSAETEDTDISQNGDAGRETDTGGGSEGESGKADGTNSDNSAGNQSGGAGTDNTGKGVGNMNNTAENADVSGNTGNNNSTVNPPTETAPKKPTCTISISCAAILNNMDKLDRNKKDLVPEDGWILEPVTVEFEEGETVFDLLKRICRDNKIHMESSLTPMYNSAYIEGIHNLYEFDCGNLSGWMYSVNGVYPNYGCSKAVIKEGDVIKWVYTCDLGNDV